MVGPSPPRGEIPTPRSGTMVSPIIRAPDVACIALCAYEMAYPEIMYHMISPAIRASVPHDRHFIDSTERSFQTNHSVALHSPQTIQFKPAFSNIGFLNGIVVTVFNIIVEARNLSPYPRGGWDVHGRPYIGRTTFNGSPTMHYE